MVDVIGLIDWLDDVTYTNQLHIGVEKTFEEAIQSAIALEGRRFSPLLTARLRDKSVVKQIQIALTEGRQEAYQQLYKESYSAPAYIDS